MFKQKTRWGAIVAVGILAAMLSIITVSAQGPTPTKAPARPRTPTSGGPPGGGFYTGQTIMNTGVTNAAVSVVLYDSASANTYAINSTITPGASWVFFSNDPGFSPAVPAGFQGSAIVSSDQSVKAIVNVTNSPGSGLGVSGGTAAEQYDGVDQSKVGTTVSFPLAKKAFGVKSSSFYVQNVSSVAASFTASFQMGPSLTGPFTTSTYNSPSLSPGQMAVVSPGDASPAIPDGSIGSLTVTSAQNVAGSVLEYETSTSPALILQATNGWAPGDYDTTLNFPVMKKQLNTATGFTRSTGLQVQNVTGGSITVNMTYYGSGGSCAGNTYPDAPRTVAAGTSTTYLDPSVLPANCLASAKAVGTGNIAAIVNESFLPCPGGCVQRSTTYSAFPAHVATHTLIAPLYKQRQGCKWTGLTIQNLEGTSATTTAVFNVVGTLYTLNNISIPANSGVTLLDVQHSIPSGSSWSASSMPDLKLAAVTVTSNKNIVAIANEAVVPASVAPSCASTVQNNKNYEAFNQ